MVYLMWEMLIWVRVVCRKTDPKGLLRKDESIVESIVKASKPSNGKVKEADRKDNSIFKASLPSIAMAIYICGLFSVNQVFTNCKSYSERAVLN